MFEQSLFLKIFEFLWCVDMYTHMFVNFNCIADCLLVLSGMSEFIEVILRWYHNRVLNVDSGKLMFVRVKLLNICISIWIGYPTLN